MAAPDTVAAKRRRERQLRQWLRHERMTVAMDLTPRRSNGTEERCLARMWPIPSPTSSPAQGMRCRRRRPSVQRVPLEPRECLGTRRPSCARLPHSCSVTRGVVVVEEGHRHHRAVFQYWAPCWCRESCYFGRSAAPHSRDLDLIRRSAVVGAKEA